MSEIPPAGTPFKFYCKDGTVLERTIPDLKLPSNPIFKVTKDVHGNPIEYMEGTLKQNDAGEWYANED